MEIFWNKGWPHYDDMMPLMPTTVKGLNVFHATQLALNDKPNDNSDRLLRLDEEPDTDANRPEIDVAKEARQAQSPIAGDDIEECIPWSPTPPPCNSSPGPSIINANTPTSRLAIPP
jgi:hypothetical protein